MRVIIYEHEKMKYAGSLLNQIEVSGTKNFRILAEIADILDSGKMGDYSKKEDGENGMEHETVQPDKLEE